MRNAQNAFWDRRLRAGIADTRGSQIVEFAVTLPLIALFLVGIFDFSQASMLKQKLSNAAREGARVGSNQPTADLSQTPPPSVEAIARAVGQYMITVGLADCGLAAGVVPTSPANMQWKFTGTGCTNNPIVTIDRGFLTTAAVGAPYPESPLTIENTQVKVEYPYQWMFGNVVTLLVPNASYSTTNVQATATMQNLN